MEPQIVRGPVVPSQGTGIIYQVTLASGAIATNPSAFPDGENEPAYVSALVTESGRVLVAGETLEDENRTHLAR